jgi:hypothetical protein
MLLTLCTVSGLAQELSAQLIDLLKTRVTYKRRGTQLSFFLSLEEVLSYGLLLRHPLEFQGDVFFNHSAHCKIQENKDQHTYKDPISTVPEQYSVFSLHETDIINSVPTSRTACQESCQVGPRRFEGSRMQEITPS